MAGGLEFIDSVGHYSIGQMTEGKWTSRSGAGSIVSGVNTGSTFAFRGTASKTLSTSLYSSLRAGGRHKINGIRTLFGFETVWNVNLYLSVLPDGRFAIRSQGGSFAYDQSIWSLTFNQEYYIEFYGTMAVSEPLPNTFSVAWTWELKVNGVIRWTGSNNTGPAGFPVGVTNISQLYWSQVVACGDDSLNGWVGDMWVTTGESLGDVEIVPLFPRADGTTIQWTPFAGSNWQEVSEHIPDDNTSYNSTTTVNNKDLFYMDLIGAFTGTIKGAQGVWRVENEAPGATQFKGVYRSSGGTEVQTAAFAPSTGAYQFFLDTNRKSVFTGVDYTAAEIDASQTGIIKTV